MAEEPSNGELWRLIEAMRGDFRTNLSQMNMRLDRLVSTEVYAVEKAAMTKEIADLAKALEGVQAQRAADAERVTQTRRWLVASVFIPLVGLVLPVVLFMAQGGG